MNTTNKDKKEWRVLLEGSADIPIKNFFLQMKVSQIKKLIDQGKVDIDDAVDDLYELCNNIADVKHISEDLEIIHNSSTNSSLEEEKKEEVPETNNESTNDNEQIEKEIELISLDSSDSIRPVEAKDKDEDFISSKAKKEELERFLAEKQREEKILEQQRQAKVALQLQQEKKARLEQEKNLNTNKLIQEQFEQQREDWIKINQESTGKNEIDFFKYKNEIPIDVETEEKKPKKGFFKSLFSSDKSEENEESDQ
jgi:hypothetical protein